MNPWFEGEKEGETLSIGTKSLLRPFSSGIMNRCQLVLFGVLDQGLQLWRFSSRGNAERRTENGNRDGEGTGSSLLRGQAERVGLVQPQIKWLRGNLINVQ